MDRIVKNMPLFGKIPAIASISQAHRALICAAFADGVSKIIIRKAAATVKHERSIYSCTYFTQTLKIKLRLGFIYPVGSAYVDERVTELVRQQTGIRYARNTTSNYSFDEQTDLINFCPTVYHHAEMDKLFELGEQFLHNL